MGTILLLSLPILAGTVWYTRLKQRQGARLKIRKGPLPAKWLEFLKINVPIYSFLPLPLREELNGHVNVFVSEKHFEGCGGLVITEEIKVTIAAQACILLLNRKPEYFPNLVTILVYPSSYIAESTSALGNAVVSSEQHRAGESWNRGLIVLSWDDVLHGAYDFNDGHNLVFHEFAHQLDQEDGAADGLPRLEKRSQYISWARIFSKEYEEFVENVHKGHQTLIDSYGATNAAEFFAVVTETFFEKPKALQFKHPEIYGELVEFYKLNPVDWLPED